MFFKNPYTCTLIIRNYVTRKASNLKLEWTLNVIKKIEFHQANSELDRKRKASEALVTSLNSTAETEIATCP